MRNSTPQKHDFKKQREIEAITIRLTNREQIFRKHRNIAHTDMNPHSELLTSNEGNTKLLIVDQRYKTQIEKFLKSIFNMSHFKDLISCINHTDIIKQHLGIIGIRKILSVSDNPPIQDVIDVGLIPKMIALVRQTQYPHLQLEATWALTNVASGTTAECKSIIDQGGIPLFLQLLKSSSYGILQQAIWAIGNISSDCTPNRDMIIKMGGLHNLVHIVANTNDQNLIKHGCWAISNLCRGDPLPEFKDVKTGIQILCRSIACQKISDKQILSGCCWAISYHSESGPEGKLELVFQQKIIPSIIKNLQQNLLSLIVPSIRILGNLSTGTIEHTKQLLAHGILDYLEKLLYHQKKVVRKQVCWVISNITAGSRAQTQAVLVRQQLLSKIFQMFSTQSTDIRRQICFLFSNFVFKGDPAAIFRLYKQSNIVRFYSNLFTAQDSKTIQVSLQCLSMILKFGQKFKGKQGNPFVLDLRNQQTISILQKLQYHKSDSVYQLANKIIMEYFETVNPRSV